MPYRDLKASDLILRDLLARDRTVLANERTFLAYVRTALMLVISAVTLYKLFPEGETAVALTSLALLCVGAAIIGWGLRSYVRVRRSLQFVDERAQDESSEAAADVEQGRS